MSSAILSTAEALAELQIEYERRRRELASLNLAEFVGRSPGLSPPVHLLPYLELLEDVREGKSVRAIISTPPQHGKTLTTLHNFIWLLLADSSKRHAYATYAQQFAREQSRRTEHIARRSRLEVFTTQDRWYTEEGGGIIWTGVGGPLTGHGIDGLMVIDDPIKNRQEAESLTYRERVSDWIHSVALTRLHPGASVILIQTRWHLDDAAGRLIRQGWPSINLPAVGSNGALWPTERPLDWLEQQRKELSDYDWQSLYMGEPRPRGDRVFHDPHYYDELPDGRYRVASGADFAYTSKARADYSVLVCGRCYREIDGHYLYLTDIRRGQMEAPEFLNIVKGLTPDDRIYSYMAGTEKALAQFMIKEKLKLTRMNAVGDKFSRSLPTSKAWNEGRILLPRGRPEFEQFEAELAAFSGRNDPHDDCVDAIVSLWDGITGRDRADPNRVREAMGIA